MKIFQEADRARSASHKLKGPRVLVPTMGALHRGHAELIRHGRKLAGKNGTLIVSIFVNPTQFGPQEDLSRYPRPRRDDLRLCRELGVDLVFAPEPPAMYAPDHTVFIDELSLGQGLCGATRPGHFRGVCTVVAKLFLILQPQIAVFGEKDWQQLAIIRRMVRDLDFPVRILGVPTVREPDGLALSSRNQYLTAAERAVAPALRRALLEAQKAVAAGETSAREIIRCTSARIIADTGGRLDYLEIVHADTLQPLTDIAAPAVIVLAVFLGKTRLIDNLRLCPADLSGPVTSVLGKK